MEKTPRYVDTNEIIRIYNRWIEQLQLPEDAGALEGVQACLDVLMEQPIVDAVEVVHAKWIVKGQDLFCSHCDQESGYNPWGANTFSNYCPHCGAKMDLEE